MTESRVYSHGESETNGQDRLPDFLVIGAPKAGTTSLVSYLRRHPAIFLPNELSQFFARDERFAKGVSWYASLFQESGPNQICGDKSVEYTRWPEVPHPPERIWKALPNVKLIYVMRHPVDRAYSHYVHRYTIDLYPGQPITLPFEEYVEKDPTCVNSSLYMEQITRYLALFSRESLLCLTTADLACRPEEVLSELCAFLGLEYREEMFVSERSNVTRRKLDRKIYEQMVRPMKAIPGLARLGRMLPSGCRNSILGMIERSPWGRRVKRGYYPPALSPEVRQKYLDFYSETVEEVEEFLGRHLPDWRE